MICELSFDSWSKLYLAGAFPKDCILNFSDISFKDVNASISMELPIETFKEFIAFGSKDSSFNWTIEEAAFLFENGFPFSLTRRELWPKIGGWESNALNI